LNIQNILTKITIHPFFYLCAFICMITGHFKVFVLFTMMITIHELGHIIASIFYNWKIEKIVILPFGGITIFNEKINKPLIEEFVIAVSGILFQILFYLLFSLFSSNYLLSIIHYTILIFNLMPVHPLDGSKICNIIFNYLFSFKKSLELTILLSVIFLVICSFILNSNLLLYLTFFFLIIQVIKEIKNYHFYFEKFLLERHLYKLKFKKNKIIKGRKNNKMKRDYNHLFIIKNKVYKEKEYLRSLFDN